MTVHEYDNPVDHSTEMSKDMALLPLAEAELAKAAIGELVPLCDFHLRSKREALSPTQVEDFITFVYNALTD